MMIECSAFSNRQSKWEVLGQNKLHCGLDIDVDTEKAGSGTAILRACLHLVTSCVLLIRQLSDLLKRLLTVVSAKQI